MPFPRDYAYAGKTFRKCAADQLGTIYHNGLFAIPEGVAAFVIDRGPESLRGSLALPSKAVTKRVLALGPVLHGDLVMQPDGFGWSYDHFGDCVFSSLKSGAYRDAQATEWGTKEVLLDSIDEVRRVLGLAVVPERATPAAVQANVNTFGATKRRILR
jgi:hypothetical protein